MGRIAAPWDGAAGAAVLVAAVARGAPCCSAPAALHMGANMYGGSLGHDQPRDWCADLMFMQTVVCSPSHHPYAACRVSCESPTVLPAQNQSQLGGQAATGMGAARQCSCAAKSGTRCSGAGVNDAMCTTSSSGSGAACTRQEIRRPERECGPLITSTSSSSAARSCGPAAANHTAGGMAQEKERRKGGAGGNGRTGGSCAAARHPGSTRHISWAQLWLLALVIAAAVLAAAPPVLADVAVLSDKVLTQLPIWARNRTADIVMDFSKADPDFKFKGLGSISYRGKEMKVRGT